MRRLGLRRPREVIILRTAVLRRARRVHVLLHRRKGIGPMTLKPGGNFNQRKVGKRHFTFHVRFNDRNESFHAKIKARTYL